MIDLEEHTSLPDTDEVSQAIFDLKQQLLEDNPNIASYLQKIHKSLTGRPELVHILTNEQRATIVKGLSTQTGITLAAAPVKKASSKVAPKLTDLSMI